ncbi:hypothetical protein IVB12_05330 [Bradyrhizobium sp. 179]|uniref:DUF968 domain-containing protein n=1 Tax=Bradyrhizobium sp. 179 TaxID=2782648 RepID=UPI001FF72F30|nr:hypothetical protein [Bradyrhizobium sp. 179]MCK1541413.1 hypothetical protein [Bradyrhizobium sp. 179]
MTELRQRTPRQRDDAHLRFVRQQSCCIPYCKRPAEAAHIRMECLAIGKPSTGMQQKPDDKWTTPLCAYHHRDGIAAQHKMGERDFWQMVGLNPFEIAARLWIASGGAARELIEPRAARPKRVKARKPKEQRCKIPSGRPLRSRGFDKRRPEARP